MSCFSKRDVFAAAVSWWEPNRKVPVSGRSSPAATAAMIPMSPVTSRDGKAMFCRTCFLTAQETCLQHKAWIPPDLKLLVESRCATDLLTCTIGFSDNGEINRAEAPEHGASWLKKKGKSSFSCCSILFSDVDETVLKVVTRCYNLKTFPLKINLKYTIQIWDLKVNPKITD